MPSRLYSRLKRLEAQSQAREGPHGPGLAALLAFARHQSPVEAVVPLHDLAGPDLDDKIAELASEEGLSGLLREACEGERARRQQ